MSTGGGQRAEEQSEQHAQGHGAATQQAPLIDLLAQVYAHLDRASAPPRGRKTPRE